ncbi:MAG: adenylate/guanylate cyclase domain-containing protein [Deltaproteobacteria bacterium]|nr:adenylate/guanylate cyclase domain-containing protein [Deltaproteobacteria bacterium]
MSENDKKNSPAGTDKPAQDSSANPAADLTLWKLVEKIARNDMQNKITTTNFFANFLKNMENVNKNLPRFDHIDVLGSSRVGSLLADKQQAHNNLRQLEDDVAALTLKIEQQGKILLEKRSNAAEREKHIKDLESTLSELNQKQRLGFLLGHINEDGERVLLQSPELQDLFLGQHESPSFVMSIDIRRSTELMLKARSPESFATFITDLCIDLMEIIKQSYGVVDKFTGDGVLAFFPEFYSGKDAAYYAISAADKCHAAFKDHYLRCRKTFKSILIDVGLGIGIDFGKVHLVQIAGGLTVVGEPVVYACRLSGAPASLTLLNQPAYELVIDKFSAYCSITDTCLEVKYEGNMLAYEVKRNSKDYLPTVPDWVAGTAPNPES